MPWTSLPRALAVHQNSIEWARFANFWPGRIVDGSNRRVGYLAQAGSGRRGTSAHAAGVVGHAIAGRIRLAPIAVGSGCVGPHHCAGDVAEPGTRGSRAGSVQGFGDDWATDAAVGATARPLDHH